MDGCFLEWNEWPEWLCLRLLKGWCLAKPGLPGKHAFRKGGLTKEGFKSLSLAAPNLPFPSAFKPRKSSPVVWDLRSRQGPHQEDFLHPKNPNPNQSPAQPPSGEAFLPSM